MTKLLTYFDLRAIGEKRGLGAKQLADVVNMSTQGLQAALDRATLPVSKVLPLCDACGITVTQFFGIQDSNIEQYYNSQVQSSTGQKAKNIQLVDSKATEELVRQVQEKDKQISKLIDLLASK